MKQKKKTGRKLLSFLLTLVMVLSQMPGMSLTAHAETYTTNQNLSTLVLNDILDTTVQSITLTNDKDKKAFYAIADIAPTSNDGYTPVEQNGFFSLPVGLKYEVIEVAEITTGATNNGWYYTFAEVKYPLWIGGVQVRSGNASNIAGNNTASYDPDTNTLTLNNYIYDGVGYKQSPDSNPTADVIFYSGSEDLTVYLTGQNQVKRSTEDSIHAGYGIRVEGSADLVITGKGSLTVSSTNANHPTGLKVNSLTIDEGTSVSVTAGNTNKGKSKGIDAKGGINVNGTLEVLAGDALDNGLSSSSYGIDNAGSDKIIIGTKGKLTAKGGKGYSNSYGILNRGIIEVNGTLNAEGGETATNDNKYGNSYGVQCNGSFISNGKVTAKGGKGSVSSIGINVVGGDGTLTVTSGTLTVEGGTSNTSVGIMAMKTISFMDGVVNASEKSVGEMGVGIFAGNSIDIGEKTFIVSTGKTNAIMVSEGTISSQINGKGWDNTQGTGNGSLITASNNLNVINYRKVQFPETKPAATVTTAPIAKSDLICTGSAQELVTAGVASGGMMNYVLGTNATTVPTSGWSTTIPTGTDAGTYYVWYKAVGDATHTDSDAACVTVTIAAKPAPTEAPTSVPTATPKPVPKTGDNANPSLWLAMMLVALIGFAGLAVTGKMKAFRKKK